MPRSDDQSTRARLAGLFAKPEPPSAQKPRVALIVPPSPYVVPTGWEFVHRAPFEGPSVIGALLQRLGHQVTILDQREDPDPAALAAGPLTGFDVVAIATYSDSFPYQRQVARIAKAERPDRPVVLGGPLVTSAPALVLGNTAADWAVLGEGELTTIELFDLLSDRPDAPAAADIPGLAWKDDAGRVVTNPPRSQLRDLDPVPLQDLTLWSSHVEGREIPEIYMTASRGCPHDCAFCYRAMPRLAHKSPARVRAELLHLKRHGFRFVWWSDLTFVADRQRVLDTVAAFAGIDFRYCVFTRVQGVDVPTLSRLRETGCDLVMYGFESISQEILDAYNKRVRSAEIVAAIETTRAAGLKVGGLFIVGAPGETEASLERIVEFCERFREVTRVKYLSLLPGTALYRDAVARGLIPDEVAHLELMSRERSVADDEIVNVCGLPEERLRDTYRRVNRLIQVRPYEYWNPANRYLDRPTDFAPRPIPGAR